MADAAADYLGRARADRRTRSTASRRPAGAWRIAEHLGRAASGDLRAAEHRSWRMRAGTLSLKLIHSRQKQPLQIGRFRVSVSRRRSRGALALPPTLRDALADAGGQANGRPAARHDPRALSDDRSRASAAGRTDRRAEARQKQIERR